MAETSIRLLRLLALLQARRSWTGPELAERLEVTTRTVRRDVERLRELGYPVEAAQGTAGYQLGAGAQLPPLLLEDEEAVAVVLGLRAAAQNPVHGAEEASVQALVKIEQVLPPRLRHRVNTLAAVTVYAGAPVQPQVSGEDLVSIAEACRRRHQLRFDYFSPHRGASRREVEPYRLICFNRSWYLIAFDVGRKDWRTFRVDRMELRTPYGARFTARELPYGDPVAYLDRQLSSHTWETRAIVRIEEPLQSVADRIWPGMGALEPEGSQSCLLHLGAPTPGELLWMITSLDADFTLVEAPSELVAALRKQAERCYRAAAER